VAEIEAEVAREEFAVVGVVIQLRRGPKRGTVAQVELVVEAGVVIAASRRLRRIAIREAGDATDFRGVVCLDCCPRRRSWRFRFLLGKR